MCSFVQRGGQDQRNNNNCAAGSVPLSPHAPRHGKTLDLGALAGLVIVLVMAFLRRHHNGFQVVIDRQATTDGYLWVVYSFVKDGLIGLTAPSLNEARGIADSLAVVSHGTECSDACSDWEFLKRATHR